MITKKALIATGATLASVTAFAGIALGAWDTAGPAKSWADKPIVMTEVQIVHKTVHVKPKVKKVLAVRPRAVAASSGAGSAVAISDPPLSPGTPSSSYASGRTQSSAPSVSTHSSGGGYGGHESEDSEDESEHEGNDD